MKKVISTILGLGVNIIIYVVAIFILFRAGAMAYDFSYEVFGEPVVSEYADEEVRIEIKSGDGGKTVAKKLKEKQLINSELAFVTKTRLSNANLMPGVYVVKASMSADDMIEIMSDAKNSVVQQKTAEELAAEETSQSDSESAYETQTETYEGEGEQ